jgi:tetrapyrrole methylase family protein/MazG family protein
MDLKFPYKLADIQKENDPGRLFFILFKIMEKLRSDKGCLWDREQTHQSIKKNLIEEAYEAVESIDNNNYQELKEELGDILLQVVFHSQIGSDNDEFEINEVLRTIIKKLIRRHPHVFSDKEVSSSSEVLSNWEDIKKEERKEKLTNSISIFSNIPKILPALHYAYEIQNRASRLGFDWEDTTGVIDKLKEEFAELNTEIEAESNEGLSEELGDLLFSIVNLSRHLDIDSEKSLRDTCKKFIKRFDYMEKYAEKNNLDFKKLSLEEKDRLWEIAKKVYN